MLSSITGTPKGIWGTLSSSLACANKPGCPSTTMRCGYTPLRPYLSKGTNRVSRDLRGPTNPAMSPWTRTSFMIIRLGMDPWAIPRGTLASPRLIHLHHHHSSLRRQLHSVPLPTSRTRSSHLLSASMHSGMRPRSTESSSHRIWRRFALMCIQCWPIRTLFFSSSSPSRLSWLSSSPFISRHSHHCSDHQGSFLHPLLSVYCQWGHWVFCLGGGGGGGGVGVGSDRVFGYICLVVF